MMRWIQVGILIGLSACASVPGKTNITERLASWHGASTVELAAVLGQPTINERGTWVWYSSGSEQSRVGDRRHRDTNTGSLTVLRGCASCPNSSPDSSPATPPTSHFDSGGAVVPEQQNTCKYLGYVEYGTVTKLTTLSAPGTHCRFDELRLRSSVDLENSALL